MLKSKTFADGIVVDAAALKYKRPIHIYHSPDCRPSVHSDFEMNHAADFHPIYLAHVSVNFGYTGAHSTWSKETNDHYVSLQPSPVR